MKKWTLRIFASILALFIGAGLVYHAGLRHWCLHWGLSSSEAQMRLPGDELFPVYSSEATHAIIVHARPEKIWSWLMQIGQDRSGFYSYTFLENAIGADMPKVEHLIPEWKPRAVGETVWFANPKRFGGQGRMVAAVVRLDRSFVLVMPDDWKSLKAGEKAHEGFWSFNLQPLGENRTRLVARVRGGPATGLMNRAMDRLFWEPAHWVMEQRMLRRIRDLAENS